MVVVTVRRRGGDFIVAGLVLRGLPPVLAAWGEPVDLGGHRRVTLWKVPWPWGFALFPRILVVFLGFLSRLLLGVVLGGGGAVLSLLFLGLVNRTLGPFLFLGLFLFLSASLVFLLASATAPVSAILCFSAVVLFFAVLLFLISNTFFLAVAALFPPFHVPFLSFAIFFSSFAVSFPVFAVLSVST